MLIKFYKPKSEILQQYIEGYYFLTNKKSDAIVEYFTFPNNFSIISIIENAEIIYSENKGIIIENQGIPFTSDLICHYKKPIKLSYEGSINELTFYFKPLGLNAFLDKSLCNYTNDFFSSFIPFDDYKEIFSTILKETDLEKRIELIENYWLSKLKVFQHSFLNQVIDELKDNQNDYSISDLANKYGISRQNLTKHFEANLCKSPSDFKKIQRFRNALKNNIAKNSKGNLTSLSYDLLFYDQSHLIKDFKSLTGMTPKTFFKNISSEENGEINWLFL
ncbi:AraC family transcriptional regulator [Flavobacterium sp. SUN052]|uniref:helix-turn-helix domain-containing protein n=1 Tax=Flavobacterium sp. SUN052 TaxID=3002441 RepID=UPI00237DDFFC|nr:AraC family transcriptional regulator [Flavobacterium sp. SUN052]MEC4005568.1 AraC family transcriptional regulator [Flavobacterium sp. SUN052]